MARVSVLVDVLTERQVDAATVLQTCVDLVRAWAGGLTSEEMYRDLMANAQDAANVDQLLYQLKGDTFYAENAALIVLSAAWNYPQLETQIRELGADAMAAPRSICSVLCPRAPRSHNPARAIIAMWSGCIIRWATT